MQYAPVPPYRTYPPAPPAPAFQIQRRRGEGGPPLSMRLLEPRAGPPASHAKGTASFLCFSAEGFEGFFCSSACATWLLRNMSVLSYNKWERISINVLFIFNFNAYFIYIAHFRSFQASLQKYAEKYPIRNRLAPMKFLQKSLKIPFPVPS